MKEYIKNLGKVRPTSNGVWNKNKKYDILCVVKDIQTRNVYISKKDVPANIEITNTEYWDNIINNELDFHFYYYSKFESLNKNSTPKEINDALHTINGEFRLPRAGDVLIDLENNISSIFIKTKIPITLNDNNQVIISYFYDIKNDYNSNIKTIILKGTNYENEIIVYDIKTDNIKNINELIIKNKKAIDDNTKTINNLNNEFKKHRTILNFTYDAFKYENWGDWELNITFNNLIELIKSGTVIQVNWDNKLCIDSAYYEDENSIHLRFDNIDYSNTENPYHNFITLVLTKGSSDNKVNIRRYYTNSEDRIIYINSTNAIISNIKTIDELIDLHSSGKCKIVFNSRNLKSYIISNFNRVYGQNIAYSYIPLLKSIEGGVSDSAAIACMEFKQLEDGIYVSMLPGASKIPIEENIPILDENKKIPASYLPNYTDDVVDLVEILDALPPTVSYNKDEKFGVISSELQGPTYIYISNGRGGYTEFEKFSVDKLYLVNKESNVQHEVIPPMSIVKWTGEHIAVLNKSLALGFVKGTAFDGAEGNTIKKWKDKKDVDNITNENKLNNLKRYVNSVSTFNDNIETSNNYIKFKFNYIDLSNNTDVPKVYTIPLASNSSIGLLSNTDYTWIQTTKSTINTLQNEITNLKEQDSLTRDTINNIENEIDNIKSNITTKFDNVRDVLEPIVTWKNNTNNDLTNETKLNNIPIYIYGSIANDNKMPVNVTPNGITLGINRYDLKDSTTTPLTWDIPIVTNNSVGLITPELVNKINSAKSYTDRQVTDSVEYMKNLLNGVESGITENINIITDDINNMQSDIISIKQFNAMNIAKVIIKSKDINALSNDNIKIYSDGGVMSSENYIISDTKIKFKENVLPLDSFIVNKPDFADFVINSDRTSYIEIDIAFIRNKDYIVLDINKW